jgi:excisionase family DNA binding protein
VITGLSERKIRELLKSGEMGSVRVGTRWVVPMTEIERYLAENTTAVE